MKISELLKGVSYNKILYEQELNIKKLSMDTRLIEPSSLFFCIEGNNTDSHILYKEAIEHGAVAFVTEKPLKTDKMQIIVDDSRKAMSRISANFYAFDKTKPIIIGVVGTNGKTTITYMIKSILENCGFKVGVIGTLGISYGKVFVEPTLTTPDCIYLHEIMQDMVSCGTQVIVMEVSAHAIALNKVDSIYFDQLIFTNCTEDHLDYFKSMEEYSSVKRSIFKRGKCAAAIVNTDDKLSLDILKEEGLRVYTYALYNPSDVFAVNLQESKRGAKFVVNMFDKLINVEINMTGGYNVSNALAASTSAFLVGCKLESIAVAFRKMKGVEGRMQFVESYNGADIFVDFAHTPDGVENALKSLKKVTSGRLICLFGCGGNREKEKRPIMGEIAGKYADFTVITCDNPRFEDPYEIIRQIEEGIRKVTLKYITIQNRRLATGYALSTLKEGDTLVLLGKGGENYQEIMGVKHRYSDVECIKELVATLDFSGEIL